MSGVRNIVDTTHIASEQDWVIRARGPLASGTDFKRLLAPGHLVIGLLSSGSARRESVEIAYWGRGLGRGATREPRCS